MNLLFIHFGDIESLIYLHHCLNRAEFQAHKISILCDKNIPSKWRERFKYTFLPIDTKASFFEKRKMKKKLKEMHFDYLIDVQRDFYKLAHYFAKKLKIENKIGYNFASKTMPYNFPVEKKNYSHLYHYYQFALSKHFNFEAELLIQKKESQNNFLIFINCSSNLDNEYWQEDNIYAIASNPSLQAFQIRLIAHDKLSVEMLNKLERLQNLELSKPEEQSNSSIFITLLNEQYCESLLEKKLVLLLDAKNKKRKLRYNLVEGSSTVTARFDGETISDIQFDTVLKAVREIIFKEID